MKLSDIYLDYNTDKGTDHNYIDAYEALFKPYKEKSINLLEIGVLFGGSLKMWHKYFSKGLIYGVDDFSQDWSNDAFGGEKPDPNEIRKNLRCYERIRLIECDSTNSKLVDEKIVTLNTKFDIIIDDGGHNPEEQIQSFKNFMPLVNQSGVYVIEDVQGLEAADKLMDSTRRLYPNKSVELLTFDIEKRLDDILIVIN